MVSFGLFIFVVIPLSQCPFLTIFYFSISISTLHQRTNPHHLVSDTLRHLGLQMLCDSVPSLGWLQKNASSDQTVSSSTLLILSLSPHVHVSTHFIFQLKHQFSTAEPTPLGLQTLCNALPPLGRLQMCRNRE
jgi:hypothetical protein